MNLSMPYCNLGPDFTEEMSFLQAKDQRLPKADRLVQETTMPKINEMIPSNYLKQADIDQDYIVTVRRLENKNVARPDDEPDNKWLVHFDEFDKPMVLNSTNIQLMAQACGSDDTDDWTGKEVVIYTDPNVSFGGKLVGGLRIKKHRTAQPPKAAPRRVAPDSQAHADEDIPF